MNKQEILNNIYPILKPFDWKDHTLAFCHPLIWDTKKADLPWVSYGFESSHSVRFLNREEAAQHGWTAVQSSPLIQTALMNLKQRNAIFTINQVNLGSQEVEIVLAKEDFFSAENILDSEFLDKAHQRLKSDLLLAGIPIRGQLACAPIFEDEILEFGFGFLVAQEYYLGQSAPISPHLYVVKAGQVIDFKTGNFQEAARIAVEKMQNKIKKQCTVETTLLKDNEQGDVLVMIYAGGVDFDRITSEVIKGYMNVMAETQKHKYFEGRVEVWVNPSITPNNKQSKMFMSDIKMHLESIARNQNLEKMLGKPIQVKVVRKSLGENTTGGEQPQIKENVPQTKGVKADQDLRHQKAIAVEFVVYKLKKEGYQEVWINTKMVSGPDAILWEPEDKLPVFLESRYIEDQVSELSGTMFTRTEHGRQLSKEWLLENADHRYLQHIDDPEVMLQVKEMLTQIEEGRGYEVIIGAASMTDNRIELGTGLDSFIEEINPGEENPGWRFKFMIVNKT